MKIFIGSSTKYLDVAKKIALIIEEKGHQPQLWKNCFVASEYTFEKLLKICESVDAGIFILAPDDKLLNEGNNEFITRDNVLIEAGMFMGKLGNPFTALCTFPEVKIPSDFLGITSIPYTNDSVFYFQEKIVNWIEKVEQAIAIKNRTVFLQDKLPDFRKIVLSAKKEIVMVSFFMSIAQISKELNQAIVNGINVRFLLPDLWGENWMATVALLDGVGQDERRAKRKLTNTLLWLLEKKDNGQIPDSFEIRLLDCVFPIRMTIIDPDLEKGEMYIHINSYINKYGNNITYNLTKKQYLFTLYINGFKEMWNDARRIDFNQVKELL